MWITVNDPQLFSKSLNSIIIWVEGCETEKNEKGRDYSLLFMKEEENLVPFIQKAKQDDWQAIEDLFNYIRLPLLSYLLRLGATPDEVEEVAQQSMIQIYRCLHRFNLESRFLPWCMEIAKHTLYKQWRSQQREKNRQRILWEFLQNHEESYPPVNPSHLSQWYTFLRECLEELNETQRKILDLKYEKHRSSEEIGLLLGLSSDTVRQRLVRIRQWLRGCIEGKINQDSKSHPFPSTLHQKEEK